MNINVSRSISLLAVLVTLVCLPQVTYAAVGQWSPNGSSIYYMDGNIGIGTSTPAAKLNIVKGNLFIDNGEGSSGVIASEGNVILRSDRDGDSTGNVIAFQDYKGAYILTARDNGTVGIGTTTPTGARFHVDATSGWAAKFSNVGSDVRAGYPNYGIYVSTAATGGEYLLQLNSNSKPKFQVNANGYAYLDGTLRAREILVKSNVWADYVFDKDYDLMSLLELEKYIEENAHLPNIPSAKEVVETGISVGEMQRLQMEKIEELTLHLIDKDKEIEDLTQRVISLEKLLTVK